MKFPDWSPVNGRPVRFDPCAPGAKPSTITLAFGSPNPGTGLAQYSHSMYARRFSFPIRARYSTSRSQRPQATTSSFNTDKSDFFIDCFARTRLHVQLHPQGAAASLRPRLRFLQCLFVIRIGGVE